MSSTKKSGIKCSGCNAACSIYQVSRNGTCVHCKPPSLTRTQKMEAGGKMWLWWWVDEQSKGNYIPGQIEALSNKGRELFQKLDLDQLADKVCDERLTPEQICEHIKTLIPLPK